MASFYRLVQFVLIYLYADSKYIYRIKAKQISGKLRAVGSKHSM